MRFLGFSIVGGVESRMRKSLLVVDDEKLVRWTIQETMGREDFKVVAAQNGADAVEKMKTERFDIIITDLLMPDLNGIDVARKAREVHPETKVVMMTAYNGVLDKEEAREAGVSDFIEKPFLINDIKHVVSKVLYGK